MISFNVITPFPAMFNNILNESILLKAKQKKIAEYNIFNLFDFLDNSSERIDDYPFGDLEINTLTYIAKLDDNELHLPRKEFELLAFFMNQPNMIFSREELLSKIWEEDVFVVDRTIDVHINRIRSKLGIYKNWIETVKGVGYRFRPKI